ncbi:hypothetical protein [Glycomyces tenuis]|uniref:hypothetical protein n=1 Tax=Glycomyces tenuis TaxID=58116 RepID=UPI00041EE06D|nr:hypothetical protein [Glycomyces tenuis]
MSDTTRAALYGVATAVLALLSVLGYVSADEQSAYAEAVAQSLVALATLMAAVKTFKQRGDTKAE